MQGDAFCIKWGIHLSQVRRPDRARSALARDGAGAVLRPVRRPPVGSLQWRACRLDQQGLTRARPELDGYPTLHHCIRSDGQRVSRRRATQDVVPHGPRSADASLNGPPALFPGRVAVSNFENIVASDVDAPVDVRLDFFAPPALRGTPCFGARARGDTAASGRAMPYRA